MKPRQPEDESKDPVGDGHADADYARNGPSAPPQPPDEERAPPPARPPVEPDRRQDQPDDGQGGGDDPRPDELGVPRLAAAGLA